jgi:hypothetical protein
MKYDLVFNLLSHFHHRPPSRVGVPSHRAQVRRASFPSHTIVVVITSSSGTSGGANKGSVRTDFITYLR